MATATINNLNSLNDLNAIIKSNVQQMNIIVDAIRTIVKTCSSIEQTQISKTNKVLLGFKDIMSSFGDICNIIIDNKSINTLQDTIYNIKRVFKLIEELLYTINNVNYIDVTLYNVLNNPIIKLIDFINEIINKLNILEYNNFLYLIPIKIKMFLFKTLICDIYEGIQDIIQEISYNNQYLKNSVKSIFTSPIISFIEKLHDIITYINNLYIFEFIGANIKLKLIRNFIKNILNQINDIFNDISLKSQVKVLIIIKSLQFILNNFSRILYFISEFLSAKIVLWIWMFGRIKLIIFKRILNYIALFINELYSFKLNSPGGVLNTLKQVLKLHIIIRGILGIIDVINNINIPFVILFKRKVNKIRSLLNLTLQLFDDINEFILNFNKKINIDELQKFTNIFIKFTKIMLCISAIQAIITQIFAGFIIMVPIILIGSISVGIVMTNIMIFCKLIEKFTNYLNKYKDLDKVEKIRKYIENFKTLIQDLKSIFGDIIKLSLLSILLVPAMIIITVAMPIIVVGVTAIVLGVFAISKLFNLINNLGLKRAKRASRRILLLIANIALICVSIILFAITIIPMINILIAGILAIVLIFTMLAIAIKIMSIASKLMGIKNFLSISFTLLAVSLITLALIGVSMLLVLLQEQAKQVDILTISLFMVGIIVFVAILAALGYACVVASPILVPAAIAIVLLAAVTLVVVGSLLLIAYLLDKLSNISLDSEAIKNTVNVVFETANDIINAIFQSPREEQEGTEKESWWSSALKWLGDSTVGKLFKSLMTVVYLAQIIATVYLIKWIADCLNQLQNIKLDRIKVNDGVDVVLSTADSIIQKITTYKNKDFKDAHNNLIKYENVIKVMVNIQDKLERISNHKDIIDGCLDLITIVSKFNDTFNNVDEKKTVAAVKEYTKFLKQVDSMNLNKLETTVKLFEEMARFSESINGNFESLADSLNEKIAPLLEELKELVGKSTTTTQQPTPVTQQNTSTTTQQPTPVTQQTTSTTTQQTQQNAGGKYEDYWSDNIEGIINELNGIKNMFLNGEAQVKTI